ncbi:MAG: hypothetical protein B6I34_00910 [Anaerolineaceae bacterium 4572_32.1]|nr:MAG: hypothetical protein B6I34_00910 [Anaerolineaceae bacterium 4572_32.1]
MYQKITIIGNLGKDPEMRYTANGTPVTSFSVATNRRWKNDDGSKGEETVWFRVSAWRGLAEICNQYLSKGRQVFVEGRLQPDKATGGPRIWTGNDGQPRASFEITALTVQFLGSRGEQAGGPPSGLEEPPGLVETEDIPF